MGDLARIQLRFFGKVPLNKTHLESIVYAQQENLNSLQLSKYNYSTIEVALSLGNSLNKLLNTATNHLVLEINPNFLKRLIESIKMFIVEQVISN